jgi:hypothetical protein
MVYVHFKKNQFKLAISFLLTKNIMIQAFWSLLCSPGPPKGFPGDNHTSIVRADCYIVTLLQKKGVVS